jgi:outer membrane protein assembly factor BamA
LTLYTFFGYDEEFLIYYENIFLDRKRNHSLSFYYENLKRKETSYIVSEDILRQLRSDDEYVMKSSEFRIKYTYRKKLYNSHSVYAAYENRKASDTLLRGNPEYLNNPQLPGKYFSLKYVFLRDKRDSRIFPAEGHKIEFSAKKTGLGIFPESEINAFYMNFDLSLYNKINDRLSYNTNITLKKTFGSKNPFFLNQALGYLSRIRAYEYYVVNGRDLFLMKNSFYGKLIPKKIVHLKFLPWNKFNKVHFTLYGGIFSDIAYVTNKDDYYNIRNDMANQMLHGFGAGLNLITYYDKMLRIEYSWNKDLKGGFHVHFEAPF